MKNAKPRDSCALNSSLERGLMQPLSSLINTAALARWIKGHTKQETV
jgi:hypothetical protein